jgi:hypothetical protein
MKLEIKDLAPYLPCSLKMIFEGIGGRIIELQTLGTSEFGDTISGGYGGMWLKSCGFKPILRPLSDLTKEIEINGETFVPYDKLKTIVSESQWRKICDTINDNYNKVCDMPYWYVRQLHQWHFDTEGLIEQGLAIDINTLNVRAEKAEASKV